MEVPLRAGGRPPGSWPIGIAASIAVHGLLCWWALRSGPPERSWSATSPSPPDNIVDLTWPPPALAPPPPLPARPAATRRAAPQEAAGPGNIRVAARGPAAPPKASSPPSAAALVAAQPRAGTPVDLTGEPFIAGTATASAGGATVAAGSATRGIEAGRGRPRAATGADATAPDLSTAVSLAEPHWSCPWPREADAAEIDEQTVVIRVIVGADGTVQAAEMVADPGGGFGPAAVSCAVRTRFTPAHDRAGQPMRARSPPIKVRFIR